MYDVKDRDPNPNRIHTLIDTWMNKKVHKWTTTFAENVSISTNYITSKKTLRWGTDHRVFACSETRAACD